MTELIESITTNDRQDLSERLLERARWLMDQPEFNLVDPCHSTDDIGPLAQSMTMKGFQPGFMGFGSTKPGDRVLLATTALDDPDVRDAIVSAFREREAKVDLIVVDNTPDRPIQEDDELLTSIRREPITLDASADYRRHYDIPWATRRYLEGGYDLFVQGRGAALGPWRWEGHPWTSKEIFLSDAIVFPRELHLLINEKSWAPVWEQGKGARVRVTDPEGTDFSWTLLPEFWSGEGGFAQDPVHNHHMYHPIPPIVPGADAKGVVAGTTGHFSKPYPQVQLHVERGCVEKVEGGGAYGDGLRDLVEETRDIQYPDFPDKGILWFWEAALGTNPKVARPSKPTMISSGGTEWERWRAGALHFGFGTCGPSNQESWASERGYPFGHVHVHQFFPTIELTKPDGTTFRTCDQGRLTVFDDPEVRACAARYGDPDEVLAPLWTPPIPGVSIPGELSDYLREPAKWFDAPGA
jgi:hypothetical protein